MQLIADGRN